MAEGFRFIYLAFGFIKAENFSAQHMCWFGANLSARVNARAGGCVIHRCQNKKNSQIEELTSRCERRHAPEAHAEDLGDFAKVRKLS